MTPTERLSLHPALAEQAMRDLQAQLQRQWQPIETAPKDQQILLGVMPSDSESFPDGYASQGCWQEGWEDSVDDMGCDDGFVDCNYQVFSPPRSFGSPKYQTAGHQPTHWMPLPPPPRCSYCGGTGDVHSLDGEWRGLCACPAESNPAAL